MVTIRIRSWRPAMPSISWPRSTVASNFTVTPFVSGATCSLLIVLSSLYLEGLTAWVRNAVYCVILHPMFRRRKQGFIRPPGVTAFSYWHLRLNRSRPMRPEEGTYVAHRQGNPLFGFLPRENAHFGLWRKHRGLHGDGVGMGGDIVRQDQDGRLALAYEIACHRVDEVVVAAIHLGQKFFDHLDRDLGPALDQLRSPATHAAVIHDVGHLRPKPDGLCQHCGDNTIRCPLQEVPDERATNAETQRHELVDAQVIHHTELVIGK